jgi:hypothetical protein
MREAERYADAGGDVKEGRIPPVRGGILPSCQRIGMFGRVLLRRADGFFDN